MLNTVVIQKQSHEGRGIAYLEGKVCFVDNALVGEEVVLQIYKKHGKFLEARATQIIKPSTDRTEPLCAMFGQCGGCSLQHMSVSAQIAFKQSVLAEQLQNIIKVEPDEWLSPIQESTYAYRHKARLGARFVNKKNEVVVGFREQNGRYIADLKRCEVLHPLVGGRLAELKNLLNSLNAKKSIAQIEVAVSDHKAALIIRHLEDLKDEDLAKIEHFAKTFDFQIYLQSGGLDTISLFYPKDADPFLTYRLPQAEIDIAYAPQAFTQVNFSVNVKMIEQAMRLLQLSPQDQVLDLFCGVGNFTLPIAKEVQRVVGIEGDKDAVIQASQNAKMNAISNAQFIQANLFDPEAIEKIFQQFAPSIGKDIPMFNKIILDPPRAGALEVVSRIEHLAPSHILYISCHLATLVRDLDILINQKSYRLQAAGVMDMFAQTAHVESMCLLVK